MMLALNHILTIYSTLTLLVAQHEGHPA